MKNFYFAFHGMRRRRRRVCVENSTVGTCSNMSMWRWFGRFRCVCVCVCRSGSLVSNDADCLLALLSVYEASWTVGFRRWCCVTIRLFCVLRFGVPFLFSFVFFIFLFLFCTNDHFLLCMTNEREFCATVLAMCIGRVVDSVHGFWWFVLPFSSATLFTWMYCICVIVDGRGFWWIFSLFHRLLRSCLWLICATRAWASLWTEFSFGDSQVAHTHTRSTWAICWKCAQSGRWAAMWTKCIGKEDACWRFHVPQGGRWANERLRYACPFVVSRLNVVCAWVVRGFG